MAFAIGISMNHLGSATNIIILLCVASPYRWDNDTFLNRPVSEFMPQEISLL